MTAANASKTRRHHGPGARQLRERPALGARSAGGGWAISAWRRGSQSWFSNDHVLFCQRMAPHGSLVKMRCPGLRVAGKSFRIFPFSSSLAFVLLLWLPKAQNASLWGVVCPSSQNVKSHASVSFNARPRPRGPSPKEKRSPSSRRFLLLFFSLKVSLPVHLVFHLFGFYVHLRASACRARINPADWEKGSWTGGTGQAFSSFGTGPGTSPVSGRGSPGTVPKPVPRNPMPGKAPHSEA